MVPCGAIAAEAARGPDSLLDWPSCCCSKRSYSKQSAAAPKRKRFDFESTAECAGQRSYIPGVGPIRITAVEQVELAGLTDEDAVPDGWPRRSAANRAPHDLQPTARRWPSGISHCISLPHRITAAARLQYEKTSFTAFASSTGWRTNCDTLAAINSNATVTKAIPRGFGFTLMRRSEAESSPASFRHPSRLCLPPLETSDTFRIRSNDSRCKCTSICGSVKLFPAQRARIKARCGLGHDWMQLFDACVVDHEPRSRQQHNQ